MFSGLWRERPKIVSCTVRNPVLGCFPPVRNKVCTVRETLLGLPAQRPQITLAPSLKHFRAFWLFRHLYQASGVAFVIFVRVVLLQVGFGKRCWRSFSLFPSFPLSLAMFVNLMFLDRELRWAEMRVLKRTRECRNTRFKNASVSKIVGGFFKHW